MASTSGSVRALPPQTLPIPLPTDEEIHKYMQYVSGLPHTQDMLRPVAVNPGDLGIMAAKFHMMTGFVMDFMQQENIKLREKCCNDDSTIKKLVGEKADLEKRLLSVTEELNSEMDEVLGLNLKLNREMEEVRGLNLKLNREMEELGGRNAKLSNRLVVLGGEIEVAREETEFHRSKNQSLCSEVEQARVENQRLQGIVDGFGAREHAIKLEGVNEFASGPRFRKRLVHLVNPAFMYAAQMGVNQMAKIAGVLPVPFKWVSLLDLPDAGPYKIPKLGEVELDNERTLEAWDVTEVYDSKKKTVLEVGKRKANDSVERVASRRRTVHPASFKNPVPVRAGASLPPPS